MAKKVVVCPFSKGMCIECAVYRGRHVEVCFAAKYSGGSPWPVMEKKQKPVNGSAGITFDVSDLPDCSKRLKDVEDLGC
jgi:hypothetical protein